MLHAKRVYESPSPNDDKWFLVKRLWLRGIKKEVLRMEAWLKEVAPSDSLRCWFHHDPVKRKEFRQHYHIQS
jgi:uncharacterized protein YeaO (DUF488 family)